MKIDYNFLHLVMNGKKVNCGEGAKGSLIRPSNRAKMAKIERIGRRKKRSQSLFFPEELSCCPKAKDALWYSCPAQ